MPAPRSTASKTRSVAAKKNPWIRAARSLIHGRGVYARVTIPDGTRIVQYLGERITKAEALRREDQRLARLAKGKDGCVYIFQLNKRHDLDGRTKGNVARLINHSCNPNCRAETSAGKIWIIARREIPAGAEISFDYGYSYNGWREHPCRCGSPRCPGYIINAAQRWLVRRALRADRSRARKSV